jgi:small subunit ribosomal protein S1
MADPIDNNVAANSAEGASAAHEPPAFTDAAAESSSASNDAASMAINGASEAREASEQSAESHGDGDDAGTEGEGDADGASGEEGAAASGDEAGPGGEGKKKRRRKRRRKGAQGTLNGEGAPNGEGGGEQRPRKRDGAVAPLARFFTGANSGKRHGFAVGEVVAGRVKQISDGVITVDLFGKALALVDEHEPREVPVAPAYEEPKEEVAKAEVAPEAEAEAVVGEAAAAPEAVQAEAAAPAEAATAEASIEAEAPHVVSETASGELAAAEAAVEADAEAEAQNEEHEEHDDHEGHGAGRGPMTPLPVVPEALGRPEAPAMGSVFRGRVGVTSESGHIALVNRLIERSAVVAELEQARVNRRRVEGMVFGFNRGGFDVLVAGMRAFCPASAMSLSEIDDPNQLVGKKMEFLLPAAQPVGSDIIVSRRSILERQQRKAARDMLKGLTPGQKFKGIVHAVREFGLIVDIGGIEGLVHQSELSWAHGVRPQDVAKPGDAVEVQVLRIGAEGGRDQGPQRRDRMTRVGLSIKALLPDPWDAHQDVLREGCVQKGTVTRTTDFGAFIQLAPEIEGLLHITELGRDLKHASAAVNEGDEIHVVVERVDRRARRIALSKLTAAEVAEFEAGALEAGVKAVRPGTRITVKVERVEPRGLLVRVQGAVGRRARGYVPRSEMGEAGAGDMRKRFPQGSSLEVKVVGIDRDGGLRCSPKALQVDDERKAIKDYRREAAQQGFGTFGDLLRAKLGEAGPK